MGGNMRKTPLFLFSIIAVCASKTGFCDNWDSSVPSNCANVFVQASSGTLNLTTWGTDQGCTIPRYYETNTTQNPNLTPIISVTHCQTCDTNYTKVYNNDFPIEYETACSDNESPPPISQCTKPIDGIPPCASQYIETTSSTQPLPGSYSTSGGHSNTDNCTDVKYHIVRVPKTSGTTKSLITQCTSCETGFELQQSNTYKIQDNGDGTICYFPYIYCVSMCSGGTYCTSDTDCAGTATPYCGDNNCCVACKTDAHCQGQNTDDWIDVTGNTGKQQSTIYTCQENQCVSDTQYRCAANFYGDGETCTACPDGSYSEAGTTSNARCCRPSGEQNLYEDENGNTFYYESDCCFDSSEEQ